MSEQDSDILYESTDNTSSSFCCCLTDQWCFQHTGLASIKGFYDNNSDTCCICLDYCTWCLEFRTRKYSICKKQTVCYLCCCSIYFI